MRILAVDTSSRRGSICFAEDDEILGEIRLATSVQHSQTLFRSIEFLLDYLPFGLADVDVFAAAVGPGSFTGLRVGMTAMQGFAAAYGRRGAGVSNLEALAWKSGVKDELIAPVIDARRGEVYAALYRRIADRLIEEQPPGVFPPEAWFASLPDSIHFCGDGAKRYRELISRPQWSYCDMPLYLATAVAQMTTSESCGLLEPMYIRRTDAEILRELRDESIAGPNQKS